MKLQCGHDPKAVENRTGPGLGPGRPLASMRPRPEGRGEPGDRRNGLPGVSLQCGHDPKAVENGPHNRASPVTARLQCGHGPKAVENDAVVMRIGAHSFNAATARRPWRTAGQHAVRSLELQCGHGPKAVENVVLPQHGPTKASMRPRPEGRGEPVKTPLQAARTRFNAATARRPWRTARVTSG